MCRDVPQAVYVVCISWSSALAVDTHGLTPVALAKPTVSLDIISLVASSCSYYRGQSEHRAAHEFVGHVATQRELAKRRQHRHPPRAQLVAPMRERHHRCPRLPPRRGTAQAPHRKQGYPGGYTREVERLHRFTFLMMRGPPTYPLFASWPWPRHHSLLVGSD